MFDINKLDKWSKEKIEFARKLYAKGDNYSEIAGQMNSSFSPYYSQYTRSSVRHALQSRGIGRHLQTVGKTIHRQQENQDGSVNSSISEKVRGKKNLTQEELLEIHHFDPHSWQILRVISNEWSVISGKDTCYNYQSKIQVAPKKIDMDALVDDIISHVKPFKKADSVTPAVDKGIGSHQYAVYPLFDLHFDGKHKEMYDSIQDKIIQLIESKQYTKSLIILGGDEFHIDSISSTTTKGTQLETVKVNDMVDETLMFFEPIIQSAYTNSKRLKIISVAGNHDYMSGYFLARLLQAYFKDYLIEWDIDLYEHYKADLLGKNMICATHGDKGKRNYVSIFASKYPELWAKANNRELFSGHLHSQAEADLGGLLQHQEPTIKSDENDQWTKDNGFISRKGIITYEYNKECVTDSHFISQP